MDARTIKTLEFAEVRSWLAERAYCGLGRDALLALTPETDPRHLQRDHERVAEALDLLRLNLAAPMEGLRDPREILGALKPVNSVINPKQLRDVAAFCETARRMSRFFEERTAEFPALSKLSEGLTPLPELEKEIRRCIDDAGEVTDEASPGVRDTRREVRQRENELHKTLDGLTRKHGSHLQEGYVTQRNGRYVLPVKAASKSSVKGIMHDVSGSGETLFIEPYEVVEKTNALTAAEIRLRDEIQKALAALSDAAHVALPYLNENCERLQAFDSILTRARFGYAQGWILLEWQDPAQPRTLRLSQAHHPILRMQLGEKSMPIDLELNADDRVIVISGPNAGGKTTSLKTLGLLCLMHHCAIPIPVEQHSRLPLLSHILADIGDEQNIHTGLSTFSSHIRNLARILESASDGALVLLDELGTATDPDEGGALATALLEKLAERGATTFVSSHLAALKQWAHETPGMRNCSFFLEADTHRPTFKLVMDQPGSSEALIVAQQQGMPQSVVQRARKLLPEGLGDLSRLLRDLEGQRRRLDKRLREASQTRREAKQFQDEWQKRSDRIRERQLNLEKEFTTEKEKWLRDVRAELEQQIANLKNSTSKEELLETQQQVREMQDAVQRERKDQDRKPQAPEHELRQLEPGCRVKVESLGGSGELLSIDLERNKARVQLGAIEVEVKAGDLRRLDDPPVPQQPVERHAVLVRTSSAGVMPSLDLHGQRVDEALDNLDAYLDRAVMQGYPWVTVAHGHGTGALRRAVHERLKQHPLVTRFRFGNPGEGGAAVTIIEFK